MTHACYLLRSLNPRFRTRFYIGCTTDPRRRLRQHNGELGQGAQLTKSKRPWEMVLCVYGFSSHVNALKFEWAWQHPFESLAVREAAAKLPSVKGVPGMVTLVCTMVTLPRWNSLNLTLQFMLSNLLQYRNGSPPLPHQMRVFVAPMHFLPGKDSQDDNDDCDNLSACPDTLSQSEAWDDDGSMNTSTSTVCKQVVATGPSLTAQLYASHDRTTSPCVKSKGKKSRKGKTPQGRKGKRGGTDKLSDDPVLLELQKMGNDTRLTFETKEIGELDNYSVLSDSRMTPDETTCRSSGSHVEMIGSYGTPVDLSSLSVGERIRSFRGFNKDESLEDESDIFGASCMKTAANQTASSRSGSSENQVSEKDLSCRSIGEGILLHGALTDTLHSPEKDLHTLCGVSRMQVRDTEILYTSSGNEVEKNYSCIGSKNLASRSVPGNILTDGILKDMNRLGERIGPNEVSDDLLCRPIGERPHSFGALKDKSQMSCASGRGIIGTSGMRLGANHTTVCASSGNWGERNGFSGGSSDLPSQSIGVRLLLDGDSLEQSQKSVVLSGLEMKGDSDILTLRSWMNVKAANQKSDSGDSDIEEISLDEFQPVERHRNEYLESITQSEIGDACCILPSGSIRDGNGTRVRDNNPEEEKSVKEQQQKSLTKFFPVHKKASVPSSIYRKARNGAIYKVLEDHSNTRNTPTEMGTKWKCSDILQDLNCSNGKSVRDTALVIDSDDDNDELLEISVNEFQHSTLLGKSRATQTKEKLCSLSNFR